MKNDTTRRDILRFAGAAAALGIGPAHAADAPLDKATVTLDWRVSGYHAPFFLGLDRGIFRQHGIDLTVNPGNGSKNTILAVASGNSTFGLADASALPAAILQGVAVKMFCNYLATTPFGVMFKTESGIKTPKDLEGKSYGDFPGSATYALFPAFARKAGIDPAKVQIVNVSPAAQVSALLDGQCAATYTALNDSFVTLKHKGLDLGSFAYAEYGLNLLSLGLVTSLDTLKNIGLVKRFASAWTASVAAAKADPAQAATITKRLIPAAPDIDIQIDMMKDTFGNRLTDKRNAGKPAGWMATADWDDLIALLMQYGGLRQKLPAETLFTNACLSA